MLEMFSFLRKKDKSSLLGIDLTTHDIKIVELKKLPNGRYRIEDFAYRELPGGLVAEDIVVDTTQIGQIIKEMISRGNFTTKDSAICVPQNTVTTQNITIIADSDREIEMEIENSGKKFIPHDIEEVDFDFTILDSSESQNKNVLLVACKKKNITTRDDSLVIAGLEPRIVDVEQYVYERLFPMFVSQIKHELEIPDQEVSTILMVELFDKKLKTVLLNNGKTAYNEEHSIEIDTKKKLTLKNESSETEITDYQRGVYQALNRVILLLNSSEITNNISCIMFRGLDDSIENVIEFIEHKLKISCLIANPLSEMDISKKVDMIDLTSKASLLVIACGLAMRDNIYD